MPGYDAGYVPSMEKVEGPGSEKGVWWWPIRKENGKQDRYSRTKVSED